MPELYCAQCLDYFEFRNISTHKFREANCVKHVYNFKIHNLLLLQGSYHVPNCIHMYCIYVYKKFMFYEV